MLKKALSVYNPEDPLEKAIQNSHHHFNNGWLNSYECQLAAKALESLKYGQEWLKEENLFSIRTHHIFSPETQGDGEEIVFVTYPVYLRDILENKKISSISHDPVVFMSKALAFFLFQEYPIHIIVKLSGIPESLFQIGGLYISEENVTLDKEAIVGFKIMDEEKKPQITSLINQINMDTKICLDKTAVSLRSEGVFGLDRGVDLAFKADDRVQHRKTRKAGRVDTKEPGDSGNVIVVYDDGEQAKFNKHEFVLNFMYIPE